MGKGLELVVMLSDRTVYMAVLNGFLPLKLLCAVV